MEKDSLGEQDPYRDTDKFSLCLLGCNAINLMMKYDGQGLITYTLIYTLYTLCSNMLMSYFSVDLMLVFEPLYTVESSG